MGELMNNFFEIVLQKGYIEEDKFDEYNIPYDHNENMERIIKVATIRTENQHRAKALSNKWTRYLRLSMIYRREKIKFDILKKKLEEENKILESSEECVVRLKQCMAELLPNQRNIELGLLTPEIIGPRAKIIRDGIKHPKSSLLEAFLKARIPPTTHPRTGTVSHFVTSKMKRNELIEKVIEKKTVPVCLPTITLPTEPIPPEQPQQTINNGEEEGDPEGENIIARDGDAGDADVDGAGEGGGGWIVLEE